MFVLTFKKYFLFLEFDQDLQVILDTLKLNFSVNESQTSQGLQTLFY